MKIPIEAALTLLHEAAFGTLATNSSQLPGYPYATVVPYVLDENHCPVLCISALAEHTKNLLTDPRVSLSVVQPRATDVQATARLTWVADAEKCEATPAFLARYFRYEPATEQLLDLDFMFFRLNPKRIRFIGGVGRMGWLEEPEWKALIRLPAADEAQWLNEASTIVQNRAHLLGIDHYGIDYEIDGQRQRQALSGEILHLEAVREAALALAAKLK